MNNIAVTGRDGFAYFVAQNPTPTEFIWLAQVPMRIVLTEHDLFCWQHMNISHDDVVRQIAMIGIRLTLQTNIAVDLEPIGVPSAFPWLFAPQNGDDMDIDQRQQTVEHWLRHRLAAIDTERFDIVWYM